MISGHGVRMYFYHNSDEAEPYRVIVKSLLDYCQWLERVKCWEGVRIWPNGMNGVNVITDKRYIVCNAF